MLKAGVLSVEGSPLHSKLTGNIISRQGGGVGNAHSKHWVILLGYYI